MANDDCRDGDEEDKDDDEKTCAKERSPFHLSRTHLWGISSARRYPTPRCGMDSSTRPDTRGSVS